MGAPVQVASLYGVLNLQDNATGALRGAEGAFQSFGRRMETLGARVTVFGGAMQALTQPLADFGRTGLDTAASFDDAMREIQARTGSTAAEMETMRAFALQMGAETAFSAGQAADAFLQLLSSGNTAAEAIEALPLVMELAAAGGIDLGHSADAMTDVLAAFGLETDAAGEAVYGFTRASNVSSATVSDMVEAFRNIGGVAANYGISVEETAAALAIFAENGITGAEAGTQFRSMLNNMTSDTARTQGAWNRMGISMFTASGDVRNLNDVMEDLTVAMNDMTPEERIATITDLAGSYGQLGLSALTAGNSIDDFAYRMEDSADAADIAETRMGGWTGAVEALGGSMETLQIEVLTPFMNDVLTPMVQQITEVLNSVIAWTQQNPELTQSIVALAAGLVTAGPALSILGTGLSAIGSIISIVGAALGFLLSPLGIVIGLIAALGAAFVTNFGGIRDAVMPVVETVLTSFITGVQNLWSNVQPVLQQLYDWFVTQVMPAIAGIITDTVMPAVQNFQNFLMQLWGIVQPHLENLYNWFVTDGLPAMQAFVTDTVIPAIDEFVQLLVGIWDAVSPHLLDLADWFLNSALPDIVDFIEAHVVPNIEAFRDLLADIWAWAEPGLQEIKRWFLDSALPRIVEFINNVVVPAIQLMINSFGNALDVAANVARELSALFSGEAVDVGALLGIDSLLGSGSADLSISNPGATGAGARTNALGPGVPGASGVTNFGTSSYSARGFAVGGFTGTGPANEIAGAVHRNEYVVPQGGALVLRGGDGGGQTINVTVSPDVLATMPAAEENGRAFGEELAMELRRRG